MARKESAPEPEPQNEPAKRRRIVKLPNPADREFDKIGILVEPSLLMRVDILCRKRRVDRSEFTRQLYKEATKGIVISFRDTSGSENESEGEAAA